MNEIEKLKRRIQELEEENERLKNEKERIEKEFEEFKTKHAHTVSELHKALKIKADKQKKRSSLLACLKDIKGITSVFLKE